MQYIKVMSARVSLSDTIRKNREHGNNFIAKYLTLYNDWLSKKGYLNNDNASKQYLYKLEHAISSKDYKTLSGILHKDNKFSRALFEVETDIKLPSSNNETMNTLKTWCNYTAQKEVQDINKEKELQKAKDALDLNKKKRQLKEDLEKASFRKRPVGHLVTFILESGTIKASNAVNYNNSLLVPVIYGGKQYSFWELIEDCIDKGYYISKIGAKLVLRDNANYLVINRYQKEYALYYINETKPRTIDDDLLEASEDDIRHLLGLPKQDSLSQLYKNSVNVLKNKSRK